MPMAEAEKSMRLFAKDVMPALKELKPEPLVPAEHLSAGQETSVAAPR
jgi:hypothetical protein